MTNTLRVLALIVTGFLLVGCDPHRKEQCEWYLVPEPSQVDLVEPGWVSLCARNFISNKQRCYLRATLDYAKAVYGKPFRLSVMKVREVGPYPREVESIKVCQPEGSELERMKKAEQNKGQKTEEAPASNLDE